jgi:hypothetical protein
MAADRLAQTQEIQNWPFCAFPPTASAPFKIDAYSAFGAETRKAVARHR